MKLSRPRAGGWVGLLPVAVTLAWVVTGLVWHFSAPGSG